MAEVRFREEAKHPRRLRDWISIDAVTRLIAGPPRGWGSTLSLSAGLVAAATLVRGVLESPLGRQSPFSTYYAAVTLAAVLGGYRAGAITLCGSLAAGWYFFFGPPLDLADTTSFFIFVLTAGFEGLIAATLRQVVLRLRAREGDLRLIADELDHRVKNNLAVVQSIARQIVRAAPDLPAFQAAFEGRLKALAGAHDLLARSGWAGADLRELILAHLKPYVSAEGPRLHLHGEDLRVGPETSVTLSLALHELTTNAVKHGALSSQTGELTLSWTQDEDAGDLLLDWVERGGPKVEPPSRKGFGSTLIGRILGGSGSMDFHPEGVRVAFRVPIGRVTPALAPQSRPRAGPP